MFKDNKKLLIIIAFIVVVLFCLILIFGKNQIFSATNHDIVTEIQLDNKATESPLEKTVTTSNAKENEQLNDKSTPKSNVYDLIEVYISGAITKVGVYKIPIGSRIDDVVKLAGGTTKNADLNNINLAKVVVDGEHIIVPTIGEHIANNTSNSGTNSSNKSTNSIVNINTATKDELISIKGIGPVTADNIISYRQKNGNFASINDLKKVSKIGDATLNKIKDFITVKS